MNCHSNSRLIEANTKIVDLGAHMVRVLRDHSLSPAYLFKALALGSAVLTIEALLVSCRTRLGLRPSQFTDSDIRDAFDLMQGRSKPGARGINAGEFCGYLRLAAAATAPRSKVADRILFYGTNLDIFLKIAN